MPIPRVLEPEVMDTAEEARDYDAMDHAEVNRWFVDDFLNSLAAVHSRRILDVGTGTALIPLELCRRHPTCHVTAVDLSWEMLKLAGANLSRFQVGERVGLIFADSKRLPVADGSFDAVLSNSIIHHIPDPIVAFAEMRRVVRPGGILFVRDLMRPPDGDTLDGLVRTYAGDESDHARAMFRDSLHAALTLEEVRNMLAELSLPSASARATSDRHWSIVATC